jgi:hypothetical protein
MNRKYLSYPSTYEGLTIGDVLDQFEVIRRLLIASCFRCRLLTGKDENSCGELCPNRKALYIDGKAIRHADEPAWVNMKEAAR